MYLVYRIVLNMFIILKHSGIRSLFENSPRKWPNSHSQKLFLSNGKIVYYQDVLQLPVPLNTLHTIHLNAKSHNLL